jgi:hypothetical protein
VHKIETVLLNVAIYSEFVGEQVEEKKAKWVKSILR